MCTLIGVSDAVVLTPAVQTTALLWAAAADPWDGAPLPEPPADGPDEEIPDDYGDPAPPTSGSQAPRDPEAMALELLTTQLGARPLEP